MIDWALGWMIAEGLPDRRFLSNGYSIGRIRYAHGDYRYWAEWNDVRITSVATRLRKITMMWRDCVAVDKDPFSGWYHPRTFKAPPKARDKRVSRPKHTGLPKIAPVVDLVGYKSGPTLLAAVKAMDFSDADHAVVEVLAGALRDICMACDKSKLRNYKYPGTEMFSGLKPLTPDEIPTLVGVASDSADLPVVRLEWLGR